MLAVRNLTLSYGPEPVLQGASLQVDEGQFVSLVGPSGSGKSSLLRAVMGLQRASAGSVAVGVDPQQIGFLFQDDALLPWRTAGQNVALGLRIRGVAKAEAHATAGTWLERLGLAGFADRYPRELSGGQRKRVALAQVLALRPRLLLMDEPFASLDAIVRRRITEDLLAWVDRERLTVLLVTHDLEEAIVLSDAVYLLSGGPRAVVRQRYAVPIPRPRDLLKVRLHPAFTPLLERLWTDLSDEVSPRSSRAALAAPEPGARTAPARDAARQGAREDASRGARRELAPAGERRDDGPDERREAARRPSRDAP